MKAFAAALLSALLSIGTAILQPALLPDAHTAPAGWSAYAQQVATVEGKVVSIDPSTDSFVLKVRRVRNCDLKGLTVTVVWDEDTQWARGKRTASPSDLWIGASVTATGVMVNDVLYADTVQIGGARK